jgi:hypothetical protein
MSNITHHRPFSLLLFISLLFMLGGVWSVWAQDGVLPLPDTAANRAFNQLQRLTSADGTVGDYLGYSISLDGNRLLAGAPSQRSNTGAAYIFERNGTQWAEVAKLVANDEAADRYFGLAAALQGNTAVVAAPLHGNKQKGAVYIFKRDANGVWTQRQRLKPATLPDQAQFGISVALSGDRLVIGTAKGLVYIYEKVNSPEWVIETGLTVSEGLITVDISENTLLLGANTENNNRGAAYLYQRAAGNWTQVQHLVANDGEDSDYFGSVVKLEDGKAFIFSIELDNRGAVYFFENSLGPWIQRQKIVPDDGAAGDLFGQGVDVDGSTLVIGSFGDVGGGSIYSFTQSGQLWIQQGKIAAIDNAFGFSIDLEDGVFVSGAPEALNTKGRVYIYRDPALVPTAVPTNTNTPAPTDTSAPPTPTLLPPTEPGNGVELLVNGGFESDAVGWTVTNATSDKVKCNKDDKTFAYSGNCAWQFKGGAGEDSKIQQSISADERFLSNRVDDTVVLDGVVNAKGVVNSKLKIVISYVDVDVEKTKLTVSVTSETGDIYFPLSDFQPLSMFEFTSAPEKIKLSITNSSESGKIYYDNLSLIAQ